MNKIRHCSVTCFGSGKSEIIVTGTNSTEVQKSMLLKRAYHPIQSFSRYEPYFCPLDRNEQFDC